MINDNSDNWLPPVRLGPFCPREDVEAADDASSHRPSPPEAMRRTEENTRFGAGDTHTLADMLVVDVGC
jgi:hypothetical protein